MALSNMRPVQAAGTPGRRFMALFLPRWATDFRKRHDPGLAGLDRPLALYERQRGAMRLVALDERAASGTGLYPGQDLADARVLHPALVTREIDRAATERGFADFADWHSYASPIVSVHEAMAPYGDLLLDVTGVAHLFGGEANMLSIVTNKLRGLGFSVQGAIAPSIGAAWALAHHDPGRVAGDAALHSHLADLPVRALRLSEEQAAGLGQMGLRQVGQVMGRDRKALQARFGAGLILRLDQALGRIEERMAPRLPVAERYAERRFAEPLGLIDSILMTVEDLAIQLCVKLEAEGLGAQRFHLFLYRTDHKVMALSLNAARPTRDAAHITRLFANRAERLGAEFDPGFGIDAIRLGADIVSRLDAQQSGAFEAADGTADLARLLDRIASRTGNLTILRTRFRDTHIPERAAVLEPALSPSPDEPAAAPDPALARPLRLLPEPEPITVMAEVPDAPPAGMVWRRVHYRFLRASGPERLGSEWFLPDFHLLAPRPAPEPGAGKTERPKDLYAEKPAAPPAPRHPVPARDYYTAEDDGGRRFWLFRQGLYGDGAPPAWYLHGFFS